MLPLPFRKRLIEFSLYLRISRKDLFNSVVVLAACAVASTDGIISFVAGYGLDV